MNEPVSPQIKICGLTDAETAFHCAALGVNAIGCVFFPKSPRHVSDETAKHICLAVGHLVTTVGVFVDESYDTIMQKVSHCGLTAVQLHGSEPADLVYRLRRAGVTVIKALFLNRKPLLTAVGDYDASAFLMECGTGALPGGNAKPWDWGRIETFSARFPCILAGGLTPDNVVEAFRQAKAPAIDISSGVESSPGLKDLSKIKNLVSRVSGLVLSEGGHRFYPVFGAKRND